MKNLLLVIFVSTSLFSVGQIYDSLPKLDKEEMALKDRHGYFIDKNAIKYTPTYSAFGGDDLIMGHAFSFEFGNIGKKYSMNFTVRQFDGFTEYGTVSKASLWDPLTDTTSRDMVPDSSIIITSIPANLRFEFMPRFYFIENIGLYVAPYFAIGKNLETEEFKGIYGFQSGYTVVLLKHFILDLGLGIQYDTFGTGSEGDQPIELRPYAGFGYAWTIKDPDIKHHGIRK
jgi:hypothetical protein